MRARFYRCLLVCLSALAAVAPAARSWQDVRVFGVMGITREVAPIETKLENPATTTIQGIIFTSGTINGARIVTVRSGVGKTNSAIAATLLIDRFKPSAVIWTGTAGGVDPDVNPGDVIIATGVGYHDYGTMAVTGFVRTPTRNSGTGRADPAFFPANTDLLAAAQRAATGLKLSRGALLDTDPDPRIREGLIATGDAFVSSPALRNQIRSELKVSAVEMEGASAAQVCARFDVPMIVIRSITDRADGEAIGSYQRWVDPASQNAAALTLATIQQLMK